MSPTAVRLFVRWIVLHSEIYDRITATEIVMDGSKSTVESDDEDAFELEFDLAPSAAQAGTAAQVAPVANQEAAEEGKATGFVNLSLLCETRPGASALRLRSRTSFAAVWPCPVARVDAGFEVWAQPFRCACGQTLRAARAHRRPRRQPLPPQEEAWPTSRPLRVRA